MEHATTPARTSGPNEAAPPSTPNANATSTPSTTHVQRDTAAPATPGGRQQRRSLVPRTPGSSALACSSSARAFTRVTVHTAKCSECDLRNKATMLRCPGCTFQICAPCQERRGRVGRSLAHGNMLSPQVATPGTGGSVVRRKPVAAVKKKEEGGVGRREENETKGKKRGVKPAPKPKGGSKPKVKEQTPSDDSSDGGFAPDPASPTSRKRRRAEPTYKAEGDFDLPSPFLRPRADSTFDLPSPFLKPIDRAENFTRLRISGSASTRKPDSEMSTQELLARHGVNTPANPYKAHLLSRDEAVVSNPVIEIPEFVRRGFKARPTAEEIQNNIQDQVREKLGLSRSRTGAEGSA